MGPASRSESSRTLFVKGSQTGSSDPALVSPVNQWKKGHPWAG